MIKRDHTHADFKKLTLTSPIFGFRPLQIHEPGHAIYVWLIGNPGDDVVARRRGFWMKDQLRFSLPILAGGTRKLKEGF